MKKHRTIKIQTVKIVSLVLSSILIISSGCISVLAEEIQNNESQITTYSTPELADVGEIVDGGQIYVNGQANKLYRIFANDNEAITDIKEKVPELLAILSDEYDLSALSDANWTDYRDAMFMLFDSENCPDDYNESNEDFLTLRAFFDIYENKDKNAEIVEKKETLNYAMLNSSFKNEISEELALMLPYSEPFTQEYIHKQESSIVPYASYNVTSAISYANTYATNPNTPTYYYFSNGDCANFTSQILENAGVSQVVYSDVAKGWWHKREPGFLGIGYKHTHSQSWSMADTFARYQGIMYSTTSHSSFKSNISKGSFIVADFQNDGDWDHCGFVTDKSSSDYKVAQHTSNYNAWASSSTNGWDTIGSSGGKYARVRA